MKNIYKILFILLTVSLFTLITKAQAPQKMSYQAVVRDASGKLISNHPVGFRISILQGITSGSVVYAETQTGNSNANGLINLEIGTGATSDNFSAINWANGPYFIKTEIDPAGGANYTITGTSQLLSVPYALYAKTAESVSGVITETDPVFSASVAKQINSADTVKWNAKLSSYTETDPFYKVSVASKINSADTVKWNSKLSNYTETDPVFSASVAKKITAADTAKWSASIHKIGDSYGSGIVFYVYDGGRHGLIAATADQNTGIRWSAGTYTNTMAFADGVGAGKANTAIIIANQGYGNGATYAARVSNEYSVTVAGVTYGDWYLPSKYELNLLYQQKAAVGGFASAWYWSSSEGSDSSAWPQYFGDGSQSYYDKTSILYVRAVRAF
jgi:hypothetical protein